MVVPVYNVCTCIYRVCPCISNVCTWYILTVIPTGFRGQHRDAVLRDVPQPSFARDDEDRGSPCPEDGDFVDARPDATEIVEAISKFISGLECQEKSCFEGLHTLLSKLPVPVAKTGSNMSHSAALEGDFLPKMDEEQQKRFTPSRSSQARRG